MPSKDPEAWWKNSFIHLFWNEAKKQYETSKTKKKKISYIEILGINKLHKCFYFYEQSCNDTPNAIISENNKSDEEIKFVNEDLW